MHIVIDFLDRQLADATVCVQRAQDRLVELGLSHEAVAAGGKALEKQIQGTSAN